MTREEIISEEMELLRRDIVRRYDALGMRASGQFEEESGIETRGKKNFIIAPSYAVQLIRGRRPGKMPPVKAIERWLFDRGIRPLENEIKISSLAYLIARKIAREGTKYFQQGGTDLLDAVITPERMQRIINRLKDFSIVDLTTRIKRELSEIAR